MKTFRSRSENLNMSLVFHKSLLFPKWFYLTAADIWNPPKLTPDVAKWNLGRLYSLNYNYSISRYSRICVYGWEDENMFVKVEKHFKLITTRCLDFPDSLDQLYVRKINMRTGEYFDSTTSTYRPCYDFYLFHKEEWFTLISRVPFVPVEIKNPLNQLSGLKKIAMQRVIDLDLPTDDLPLDLQEEIREIYVFQKLRIFDL